MGQFLISWKLMSKLPLTSWRDSILCVLDLGMSGGYKAHAELMTLGLRLCEFIWLPLWFWANSFVYNKAWKRVPTLRHVGAHRGHLPICFSSRWFRSLRFKHSFMSVENSWKICLIGILTWHVNCHLQEQGSAALCWWMKTGKSNSLERKDSIQCLKRTE